MALDVDFSFDNKTYRHRLNGFQAVMHCHHYMALTIQLAENLKEIGGERILAESAEDAVRPLFDDYVKRHGLPAGDARLQMAAEFYEIMGMGQLKAAGAESGGEVILTRSHVDEGWRKKFGPSDHPINHFTCGFVAAMFGCAFDKPARGFQVEETASLARGDNQGAFLVKAV